MDAHFNPVASATSHATVDQGHVAPDYHGAGIVNLMASLRAGLGGGDGGYAPLGLLSPTEVAEARHVLLLVVDGMGHDFVQAHATDVFKSALRGRITSVFPSTTAAAITTFFTGVAPLEHGLTGWFTHLPAAGGAVAVLPFRRWDGQSLTAEGITPETCYSMPPLFPSLARESHVVHPAHLVGTPYNAFHARGARQHGYRDLPGMFDRILALLGGRGRRRYVYAYWPEFDRICHESGCSSLAARRHFADIEQAFGRFLAQARDTGALLLVTADHGFVDTTVQSRLALAGLDALATLIEPPPCGEPRALLCRAVKDRAQELADVAREALGDRALVCRSEELVTRGWFGPLRPHAETAARTGDVALVMNGNYIIDDGRIGKPVHVGEHGGVSPAEMWVPLVVAGP